MTGRDEGAPIRRGWMARLGLRTRRYYPIDGGSGAHLLAALAGQLPRLLPVPSPRHADLLLVIGPISRKLAPSVAEVARSLPAPAQALIVTLPEQGPVPPANLMPLGELLPEAQEIETDSAERVALAAMEIHGRGPLRVAGEVRLEEIKVPLPPESQREIATEPAVLSLGPIQPFTAGPLRLLLITDGAQLLSTHLEAGYARRGIVEAMVGAGWQEALGLARQLDPLAPKAGQLAFVRAVERLQGWHPAPGVEEAREAGLALERAENHLWWLARCAALLAVDPLAGRARELAARLVRISRNIWGQPPARWVLPQGGVPQPHPEQLTDLSGLAEEVGKLRDQVRRDRLLALRTRRVGTVPAPSLRAAGVTGPVLLASERGDGDAQSRLLARLSLAADDLRGVRDRLPGPGAPGQHPPLRKAPRGEAEVWVEGPRGRIGLYLATRAGDAVSNVRWHRPSAALLALIPQLLANQKLADAEVTLASLDLAMGEADG